MPKRKLIICVIGRTASGKDSLVSTLAEQDDRFKPVVSFTDRPMRKSETEGEEHYFITKEEFDKLLETKKKSIIAYTEIKKEDGEGYRYCALKDELDKGSNIYIIDPKGVEYLQNNFSKDELDIVTIYISADYNIRRHRAEHSRGDSIDVFEKRNDDENKQFSEYELSGNYEYKILNSDLAFYETYDIFETICKSVYDRNQRNW